MLLTLTTTAPHADEIGFLLHKNPGVLFSKSLTFGTVRVFYPEVSDARCTVAVQVDVDPIHLVRGGSAGRTLAQYVSDRPYVPSSFLSVALAECFGTAMGGRSKERPDRVSEKMPLSATLHALSCDGGAGLVRRVWEPLGYTVTVMPARSFGTNESEPLLDDRFPAWGVGHLLHVTIAGETTVQNLLTHLYVLVPVLDNAKHYAFGADEVDKLVKRGESWLAAHPERELIARRYLRYKRDFAADALARLADVEGLPDADEAEASSEPLAETDAAETAVPVEPDAAPAPDPKTRLNDLRIAAAVHAVQTQPPARRVIDLGCGEGRTLAALLKVPGVQFVAGMDISSVALERAARRLYLGRMGERERSRIDLFQGSLVYRDARLSGYDCALLMEVVEHIDPPRLASLVRVVWEFARPVRVVVTTPNRDYNSVWDSLPAGNVRHADHRFEWTRAEFSSWANAVAQAHGYTVAFGGVGEADVDGRGTPTQMAVFDRA